MTKMDMDYALKARKEDFIVDEVSLYPVFCVKKTANFSYILIKKAGMTTFDAIDHLKMFFKLDFSDISAEGLKDEDGITQQLLSIKKIVSKRDIKTFNVKFTEKEHNLRIINLVGYGQKALSSRQLHGNTFKIVIRNLEKKKAELFYDFCKKNRHISFINYYDSQRFGVAGCIHNTHLIGKAIIEKNWKRALKEFCKSGNDTAKTSRLPKKLTDKNSMSFFKTLNPSKIAFFIASFDSHVWNKAVCNYIKKIKYSSTYEFPLIGELSLPINSAFSALNIFSASGHVFDAGLFLAKRKLKVRNLVVGTTVFPEVPEDDDLYKLKYKIGVSFFLPTGCYATMLVKQIFLKLESYER
jgi:tRNA pseudouridine13 synthase